MLRHRWALLQVAKVSWSSNGLFGGGCADPEAAGLGCGPIGRLCCRPGSRLMVAGATVCLHTGMFLTGNLAPTDASLSWKINSKQQILLLFPGERTVVCTGDEATWSSKMHRYIRVEGESLELPPPSSHFSSTFNCEDAPSSLEQHRGVLLLLAVVLPVWLLVW